MGLGDACSSNSNCSGGYNCCVNGKCDICRCAASAQCPGLCDVCHGGYCISGCEDSSTCQQTTVCDPVCRTVGTCVCPGGATPYPYQDSDGFTHCAQCTQDTHCPAGKKCINNVCSECQADSDCDQGTCLGASCKPNPDLVDYTADDTYLEIRWTMRKSGYTGFRVVFSDALGNVIRNEELAASATGYGVGNLQPATVYKWDVYAHWGATYYNSHSSGYQQTAGSNTQPCHNQGDACSSATDCCSGLTCTNGRCQAPPTGGGGTCGSVGAGCTSTGQCCSGLACQNGRCAAPTSCKASGVACTSCGSTPCNDDTCCSGICRYGQIGCVSDPYFGQGSYCCANPSETNSCNCSEAAQQCDSTLRVRSQSCGEGYRWNGSSCVGVCNKPGWFWNPNTKTCAAAGEGGLEGCHDVYGRYPCANGGSCCESGCCNTNQVCDGGTCRAKNCCDDPSICGGDSCSSGCECYHAFNCATDCVCPSGSQPNCWNDSYGNPVCHCLKECQYSYVECSGGANGSCPDCPSPNQNGGPSSNPCGDGLTRQSITDFTPSLVSTICKYGTEFK